MAKILFVVDIEEGHLFPTFKLARSLAARGHQITYLVLSENAASIAAQGFDYRIALDYLYVKEQTGEEAVRPAAMRLIPLIEGGLNGVMAELRPDLLVIDYFLSLEALLLHYKYATPQVIFTPFLRDPALTPSEICLETFGGLPGEIPGRIVEFIGRYKDITTGDLPFLLAPLRQQIELIACPGEFNLPGRHYGRNVHHIGPCIRPECEDAGTLTPLAGEKKLIYASLGSQLTRAEPERSRAFFRTMIGAMASKAGTNLHMILQVGPDCDEQSLGSIPGNVSVVKWAAQIDILKRAELAITHGGLGTIKECIYYKVPMIVIPITRDAPVNAERIRQSRLGVIVPPAELTVENIVRAMEVVLNTAEIKENVCRMGEVFAQKEKEDLGSIIIENYLEKHLSAGFAR